MNMKRILFMALSALLTVTSVLGSETPSMSYAYYNNPLESHGVGVSMRTTYYPCILIPAVKTKVLTGNSVTAVTLGYAGSEVDAEATIWLSYDLGGEPFYTQKIDLRDDNLFQTFHLDTPHVIEKDRDLYVGWSCNADEWSNPVYCESDRSGSKADPRGDIVGYLDIDGNINWKHLGDSNLGNHLLSVTISGETLPAFDIALESVTTDNYVKVGTDVEVKGTVRNWGTEPVDSYDVYYRLGSNPPVKITPQCWTMNTCGMVSFSFTVSNLIAGVNNLTVNVTNPNGHSDANPSDNAWKGTVMAYSKSGRRQNIILEQFSTANCSQCPAGHDRIQEAIKNLDNVIWITHHAGYGTDSFTTAHDEEYTWFYGQDMIYAPAVMFDRTNTMASSGQNTPGPVTGVGDVNTIRKQIEYALSQPALADIELDCSYDSDTRALDVELSGLSYADFSKNSVKANVYLIEDNLKGRQQNGGIVDREYIHNNVFRMPLTPTWGADINWQDGKFSQSYTIRLDDAFKPENMKVVAFLANYNPEDVNDCMVINSVAKSLTGYTSVSSAAVEDFTVRSIEGGLIIDGVFSRVDLYDVVGVLVKELNGPGYVSLPPGVYIVTDVNRSQKVLAF